MSATKTTRIAGTWAADRSTGLVYYSPLHFNDGSAGLEMNRGHFRHIAATDPAWIKDAGQLTPGEYIDSRYFEDTLAVNEVAAQRER